MRVGTRGSALALAQARWVAARLADPDGVEIVPVVTSGDRRRDVEDKREWVSELEDALLRGDVDLAVHSAKDVPVELAPGCALIASPAREDARDVLCGASSLSALPSGARVGTASLRREAQLRAARPDLEVIELRGNVDTRLRKLRDGEADAIVLAAAGLLRLERSADISAWLDLVPAAGQGVLAIEARSDDGAARDAVAALRDVSAETCLSAERAVVRGLGADCRSAVGVHATPAPVVPGIGRQVVQGSAAPNPACVVPGMERQVVQGAVHVRAWVGLRDGSAWISDELSGDDPEAVGAEVSERLLAAGAKELLEA